MKGIMFTAGAAIQGGGEVYRMEQHVPAHELDAGLPVDYVKANLLHRLMSQIADKIKSGDHILVVYEQEAFSYD